MGLSPLENLLLFSFNNVFFLFTLLTYDIIFLINISLLLIDMLYIYIM